MKSPTLEAAPAATDTEKLAARPLLLLCIPGSFHAVHPALLARLHCSQPPTTSSLPVSSPALPCSRPPCLAHPVSRSCPAPGRWGAASSPAPAPPSPCTNHHVPAPSPCCSYSTQNPPMQVLAVSKPLNGCGAPTVKTPLQFAVQLVGSQGAEDLGLVRARKLGWSLRGSARTGFRGRRPAGAWVQLCNGFQRQADCVRLASRPPTPFEHQLALPPRQQPVQLRLRRRRPQLSARPAPSLPLPQVSCVNNDVCHLYYANMIPNRSPPPPPPKGGGGTGSGGSATGCVYCGNICRIVVRKGVLLNLVSDSGEKPCCDGCSCKYSHYVQVSSQKYMFCSFHVAGL